MRRVERGFLLIEVMVALAVFATAAIGFVMLLADGAEFQRRAQEAERVAGDQDRLMAAVCLLTRADLEKRLGRHTAGPYVVTIARRDPSTFRVAVGQSGFDDPDLVTVLYRPAAHS